jgi:hypothetical protein
MPAYCLGHAFAADQAEHLGSVIVSWSRMLVAFEELALE